ncbi:MAG: hypothetical protein PHW04_10780 [Candidatus Wallbacteria bacterium]|nr:hypothetical protein [Candidatus Wallbacteria bacterium]
MIVILYLLVFICFWMQQKSKLLLFLKISTIFTAVSMTIWRLVDWPLRSFIDYPCYIGWLATAIVLIIVYCQNRFCQFNLLFPFLAFPIFVNAYGVLNQWVFVKVLGCGCNFESFNANDLSEKFYLVLFLLGLAILIRESRGRKLWISIPYFLTGALYLLWFCIDGLASGYWK